ncbi:MAG TPA: hypothetical protein VKS60_25670 [Stellaceae bacterium]|nr:hypothetical protein [Stellaceae bacterium]
MLEAAQPGEKRLDVPWIDVSSLGRDRRDRGPQPAWIDQPPRRRTDRPFRQAGGGKHFPTVVHRAYVTRMAEEMGRERLEELLAALAERLDGDWLLLGGALVALWLEPRRVTEDIDLVSLDGLPEQRFQLMEFAAAAGLSIEAVNSAADYFVRRVPGWQQEIELFRTGPRARIYRPTPTLFLLVKIGRLSDQDLGDCLALIARARRDHLPIDSDRVVAAMNALPPIGEPAALRRQAALRQELAPGNSPRPPKSL